ncbi:hypothetical protein [Parasitella parasitica]|uniref:Uncharacterized protein n=1 Tax=Parasitella parasitica TaxID=35722 RepID=A0A0B7NIV0_9FUNG|nr:hypothetical protein [Parasitella parasitica]
MPPKNNVVNDLIRAAAGASARDVSDDDVDKYVADLILKEAEEKRKKYDLVGVQAYKSNTPPSSKPKPNTRFLLNMVKATDSHNQAVIRANEKNVAKLRQERYERERKQRDESNRRKDDEKHSHRHHHRSSKSTSISTSKSKPKRKEVFGSSSKDKRHSRSKSPSNSKKDRKKQKRDTAAEEVQFKGRGKVKINSSMDKYFSEGYDPLLDVEPEKEDDYVFALDDDKKIKKKKKKKSKDNRSSSSSSSSSSSNSDSSDEIGPKPLATRAWDAGKT